MKGKGYGIEMWPQDYTLFMCIQYGLSKAQEKLEREALSD